MAVLKVKPSHHSQGEFVLIEEDNFNKDIHQLYVENEVKEKPIKEPKALKETIINALGDK